MEPFGSSKLLINKLIRKYFCKKFKMRLSKGPKCKGYRGQEINLRNLIHHQGQGMYSYKIIEIHSIIWIQILKLFSLHSY